MVHQKVLRIEELLRSTLALEFRGIQVFKLRNLAIVIAFFSVVVYARGHIYKQIGEESASLGKELLAKNSRNLIETIEAVSKDPETLVALESLLVQVLYI